MLARQLTRSGVAAQVWSAGLLTQGEAPPPEVIAIMASRGADVRQHRSRLLIPADLARADLVLAMTRAELRHAVVAAPAVWPHAFTLRELVRRAEQAGPRRPGQSMARWFLHVQAGRTRQDLLGDAAHDDVTDPFGGPPGRYAETAEVLDHLISRLVSLAWSSATTTGGHHRRRRHPGRRWRGGWTRLRLGFLE